MSSKYGLLSFLIFCGILLLVFKNYEIWTQPIELATEETAVKKSEIKSEIKSGAPPAMGTQKDPLPPKSHILISEKNIFSPQRKDFPVLAVGKPDSATRPQVVLYGVTIAGEYQAASVTSPGRPLRKGEREILTLRIGEKVGDYKLAKVLPDRIALENTHDSYEVLLYDPKAPKKRIEVRTEVKPPAVTTPSTTPAATGLSPAPTAPVATQAAAPGTTPPPASAEKASPTPSVEKTSPAASVEKTKEPAQQQIAAPRSPVAAKRLPQSWQRRRGIPAYPPTSSTAGATE